MLDIKLHEMSNQKYRRTNFEEDDASSVGAAVYNPNFPSTENFSPGSSFDPVVAFANARRMTFWRRRTELEKILAAVCVILMLVILVIVVIFIFDLKYTSTNQEVHNTEVCLSKSCIIVASQILNSMDELIDPCNDFYSFSCGGWIKQNPIPSGESRWDTFSLLKRSNQIVLKNALESSINDKDSLSESKAKKFYQSCMDPNKTIEIIGAKPILELIEKLGGWPISDLPIKWNILDWDFESSLKKMHGLIISSFFNLGVGEDEKQPTQNILQLDQGGIALARDLYLNKSIETDKILQAYLKYMTDIGVLLGGEYNQTNRMMEDVLLLEQEIAKITKSQESRRDEEKIYQKMNLSEIQKLAPFINWESYLNSLLIISNVTTNSSELIVIYGTEFFVDLSNIILEKLKTDNGKIILQNYMMWHIVRPLCEFLSKPFMDVRKEFNKILSGITGDDEQWSYCVASVDWVLGFATGAIFIRERFQGDSKKSAEDMIDSIKRAFVANLPNLQWMDEETRKAAIEKAESVVDLIGFPEYILNKTALDLKYDELEINENEYFANNYRNILFNMRKYFEKLRMPPEKNSWSMTPSTVNAYYTPTKNYIAFPAGILQSPFYNKEFPRSLNYGAIGVVMGHELTHGFDDQGREYDKYGILRQWWNETSINKFKERTNCMISQYANFKSFDENINGKQTLGENIADNGGLKSAFNAYQHIIEKEGSESLLPGLNYTHQQLFFIAFAQVWCANIRKEESHNAILTDSHTLSKFRVIGTISNSKEFAQHFKCAIDAPMNPKVKCEIW